MIHLARALILTAVTMAVWLTLVRHDAPLADGGAAGCVVTYVYDGDTVALQCDGREVAARVQGLDAPETRDARCAAEKELGRRATERLRALLAEGELRLERHGHDKYGRWLIRLSAGGSDVADTLIGEALAVPYAGGRRIDWCARLEAV
jgi:endonuclease YncB( thermonuclease family)